MSCHAVSIHSRVTSKVVSSSVFLHEQSIERTGVNRDTPHASPTTRGRHQRYMHTAHTSHTLHTRDETIATQHHFPGQVHYTAGDKASMLTSSHFFPFLPSFSSVQFEPLPTYQTHILRIQHTHRIEHDRCMRAGLCTRYVVYFVATTIQWTLAYQTPHHVVTT